MKAIPVTACILAVVLCWTGIADQPSTVLGTIGSTSAVVIDGTTMSPTGSSAWPVVATDEIATQAPALLTTADHNLATFDPESRFRLNVASAQPAGEKQTYIFVRQGGLAFDARSSRMLICIGNRLFVPETLAKGTLRMDKNGSVLQHLDSGVFAEQGARSCDDSGPGAFLAGVPGSAGGNAGAAGGNAGAAPAGGITVTNTRATIAAVAATLVGVGVAVATGAFSSASSCATAGCNANPPALSTIQP
jgi:hypothetical protein